jgi:hypothetical protein
VNSMNWVKEKYDILILALATILLVSNAAWIAMSRMEPEAVQAGLTAPKDNAIPPVNLDAIRQASALADSPSKWKAPTDLTAGSAERGSLLVSRRYLLKDGKLIDPLAEGSDQLHPPLTNDWLLANGLDYTDMNIKEKDSDGDGFSNLEEFEKKTDPNDPKDAPPSFYKLKYISYNSKPLLLTFKSLSKEEATLKNDKVIAPLKFIPKDWKIDNEKLTSFLKETWTLYTGEIQKNEEKKITLENEVIKTKEKLKTRKRNKELEKKLEEDSKSLQNLQISIKNNQHVLDVLNEIFPEDTKENASITENLISRENNRLIRFEINGKSAILEIDREFQINMRDNQGNIKTQYLKLGQEVEGAPYKILNFEAKEASERNLTLNVSELTVQNTETGNLITLTYNQAKDDPTTSGIFHNPLSPGDSDLTLQKGNEFEIKPASKRKLKLLEITSKESKIQDLTTGEERTIPIENSSH